MKKSPKNKFKYILLTAVLCAVACMLSSCCIVEESRNRKNMEKIRVGMTKDQVIEIMGEPLWEESYNQPNLWYYYTKTKWFDGLRTRDECSPFVFDESDTLEGFGNEFFTKKYRMGNWIKVSQENDIPFSVSESL